MLAAPCQGGRFLAEICLFLQEYQYVKRCRESVDEQFGVHLWESRMGKLHEQAGTCPRGERIKALA